jgi:hypothetical protein
MLVSERVIRSNVSPKGSYSRRKWGLKPALILCSYAALKGPLFHGSAGVRSFSATCKAMPGYESRVYCEVRNARAMG